MLRTRVIVLEYYLMDYLMYYLILNEIHKNSGSTKNLITELELAQNARKTADLQRNILI